MKANEKIVLAISLILLVSGCSQGSKPQATSSSTPTPSTTASIDRNAVYTQAAALLQSFLDSWKKIDFYAAGQKYFDSSSRSKIQRQGNPVLISGTVTSTQIETWVSADHFTVISALDLRFSKKDAGTWGNGINTLFVTFVRSSASSPYKMTFATSPSSESIVRGAVYTKAVAYLQSFLASWQKNGLYVASQKYLDPSMRPNHRQGNPVLITGTVTRTQIGEWISADHFTVISDLDLRFSGDAGAWGNGINTRFVTFVRSSASVPYQITFATSP